MMLGKERMAELRSIAKLHNLAAGSQTIPKSVAEIAAAQGKTAPVGPSTATALLAPERKKLLPKMVKRKAPRVVSDKEADESTEDGLICKRKRGAVTVPPAAEGAIPDYTENPPAPPHHSSPLGMFLLQMPQLLKLYLSSSQIRKLLLRLPRNYLPHHHASRPPSPSNLARVVVRINLHLLPQLQPFQLLSRKP